MRVKGFLTAVVALSLTLAVLPPTVQAIPSLNLQVCRDMTVQNLGASGSQVHPIGCAREFSVSSPYVVLFMEIARVDYSTTFAWQLHAPDDQVYARRRYQLNPDSPTTYNIALILPIAATEKEIVEKNPQLRFRVIEVGAKPISEMPGEWKLEGSVGGGSPTVARFTLRP